MCGIYGTNINYNETQVKDKIKRISFRGPDKLGFETYKTNNSIISLCHNRLSIIDLDPRADQPFNYNHVHITFNGEIYNFKTLRDILQNKGYVFNTTSDTEVICAAYIEYGEDCILHFNGMFSFAIYDERKQIFFGARDRLGQKPFYYYHNGKKFEFSSQISSIQKHHSNLTISEKAISYYLVWGNIPDPQSIFNEVKKLKAGHAFTFDLSTGKFDDYQYWDIDYKNTKPFIGTYEDAKQKLNYILKDAVSTRLYADVPVGVFLSGGIDSSLVAALATESTESKIKTFSVKFNEKGFDESIYAQQVANHLKTDHHTINCNYKEGIDLINSICHFFDEPFSDSSAIPSMLLSKYTREHVTVALSGDAGDESFLGYHRYNWAKKINIIYKLPYGVRKTLSKGLNAIPNYKLKVISQSLGFKNPNDFYLNLMTSLDPSWINSIHDFNDVEEIKYLQHNHKNLLERIANFDTKTYLNWDINTKVDRASMAYSLEVRAPFLDHRVVNFANSLPTNFKFDKMNQKRILKDILYQKFPASFFDRPKSGFTMPFSRWFREDLKDFVLDELNDEALKLIPCIDVEKVKLMISQHMDGSWNRYPIIWKLLVLKQWLNKNGKGLPVL